MPPRWTLKREMFLRHYVINSFRATAAARAVGYAFPTWPAPSW
jgi:hypothetical protein